MSDEKRLARNKHFNTPIARDFEGPSLSEIDFDAGWDAALAHAKAQSESLAPFDEENREHIPHRMKMAQWALENLSGEDTASAYGFDDGRRWQHAKDQAALAAKDAEIAVLRNDRNFMMNREKLTYDKLAAEKARSAKLVEHLKELRAWTPDSERTPGEIFSEFLLDE